MGLARILREAHIPFGVVTNVNLDQLKNYRAVLLPNVLEMTAEQAAQFRQFVEAGGVLYASGPSSLDRFDKNGPRFLLEDVFGVRYTGTRGRQAGQGRKAAREEAFPVKRRRKRGAIRGPTCSPKDEAVGKLIWPQKELSFPGPMLKGHDPSRRRSAGHHHPAFCAARTGKAHRQPLWRDPQQSAGAHAGDGPGDRVEYLRERQSRVGGGARLKAAARP